MATANEKGHECHCLCNICGKNIVSELRSRNAELESEKEGWMETAAQHLRNEDYYRGLVQGIGKHFGADAYISDDGSIQQDILCAKVPYLVMRMNERLWELESGPGWSEMMAMEGKIERLEAELLEKRQSIVLTATEADKNIDELEAEVARLRNYMEQITANILAFKPSCTHCLQTIRISARALEASD